MRIGIVGFGFMGRMHFAGWSRCQGATVAAICDQNPKILQSTDDSVGNIPGLPETFDFSQIRFYSDLSKMLQSEQLDAVSITLPTYLHAACSIQSLEAGLHVLCEKPMALTLEQCDTMIAAAQHSGKHLMIGHCIRFWPEYVKAKELIDRGTYGQVLSATFQRLSAAPTWSSNNWLMDNQRSGGMALDLHIHDTDFVQSVFGMPNAVCSHAAIRNESIIHLLTHYDYENGQVICAEGGWMASPSFGFKMNFSIVLEQATLVYDFTQQPTFRIYPAEAEVFTPQVEAGDGYTREITYFAALIAGNNTEEVLTLNQSRDSVRLIEAERQSALTGRKIQI